MIKSDLPRLVLLSFDNLVIVAHECNEAHFVAQQTEQDTEAAELSDMNDLTQVTVVPDSQTEQVSRHCAYIVFCMSFNVISLQ